MPPEPLGHRITPLPPSPHSAAALERLTDAADRQGLRHVLDPILAAPAPAAFLGTALGDCPFLLDLATSDIARLAAILAEPPETRI